MTVDTPPAGATTTTLQVTRYSAVDDSHTLVLDLNDHAAFTLRAQGLTMPQPTKVDSRSSNLRVPGERVVKWQYKNRHITVQLNLRATSPSDPTSTTQLLTDVRNLLAAIEHPPYELRIALPKATQYSYADVVQCTHTIPADPQEILAGAIRMVAIDFECLPGLRGDRLTLQNLVLNPGFEAPSGPGVTAFADSFDTFNAYSVQAGGALARDVTSYADVVLADAPLRYYRLDEASGTTIYDASANGLVGTYGNTPTYGVAGGLTGDADTAVTIAAASSNRISADVTSWPSGNAALTVEFLVKIAANPGSNQCLWSYGPSSTPGAGQGFRLFVTTAGAVMADATGAPLITSGALSLGAWHYVALRYDGTTLSLNVDGGAKLTATPGAMSIPSSGMSSYLGLTSNGGSFASASLDEWAVYGVALSDARVAAHYAAMSGGPTANQASTMVVPSGGRVSFGSPAWSDLNTWQTRFRYASSLTASFYLHYTDASNYLAAVVTGTSLTLNHVVGGTTHALATTSVALTNGVPYWLVVTQFPTVTDNSAMVQAQLWRDFQGIRSATTASALVGPVGSFDAVTALSGKPQIGASGAALALGGAGIAGAGHSVSLFRPGGWSYSSTGTGVAALGVDAATTWPNGPVTSFYAARVTAAPAGTLDARLQLYQGANPANTPAIPVRTAGDVLYVGVAARSAGLGNGATVSLEYTEYDVNGTFLGSGTLQTLTISGGTQIAWPAAGAASLAGHWTTGANCAYVDLQLHVADAVAGNSAGASVWWDNAQCWNSTATGQTSMPYCALNYAMTPAQLMVSGLLGDMEAPCLFEFGMFWTSFAPGNAATLAIGRRAQASAGAQLVGAPVNFYGSGAVSTPTLDSASYGGYYISATVTSGGWNPRGFSSAPSDLLGVYHLWNRFKSGQSAGNLANVQQRVAVFAQTDAWIGLANGTDLLGAFYGAWVAPLTASNTWTVCDAGQVSIPPYNLGAATDPTQNYVTPRPQVQDTTGGGSTCSMSWELLLPVDTNLMLATINNPSNSPITITNGYLWTYFDGLGALRTQPATWSYSQETSALPGVAHSNGGSGTTTSGTLNVNPVADSYLTLDPTLQVAGVAVNQFGVALSDASGLSAECLAQIQYVPLYLYPR